MTNKRQNATFLFLYKWIFLPKGFRNRWKATAHQIAFRAISGWKQGWFSVLASLKIDKRMLCKMSFSWNGSILPIWEATGNSFRPCELVENLCYTRLENCTLLLARAGFHEELFHSDRSCFSWFINHYTDFANPWKKNDKRVGPMTYVQVMVRSG